MVERGGEFRAGRWLFAAGHHLAQKFFRLPELTQILKCQSRRLAGIGQQVRRIKGKQFAGAGEMGKCFLRLARLAFHHPESLQTDGECLCAGWVGFLLPHHFPVAD